MSIVPPLLFAPENTRLTYENAPTYVPPVHPSAYPDSRSDGVAESRFP